MVGLVRLAKLTVLFTPVNCVWLRALKASRRTSRPTRLPTSKRLETDRSRLLMGGFRTKKRADSAPSLPGCGGAKQEVFAICWYGSPLQPVPGSHVSATRAPGFPSFPVRLVFVMPGIEKLTVEGRPLVQR